MAAINDAAVGARILGEVEEAPVDEILTDFRTQLHHSLLLRTQADENSIVAYDITPDFVPKDFGIPALNDIIALQFKSTQSQVLSVEGSYLPLLYAIVANLITAPHSKAVMIVDIDRRFDVTCLLQTFSSSHQNNKEGGAHGNARHSKSDGERPHPTVSVADLAHIHVYRPAISSREHVTNIVASAGDYMLYGSHGSRSREWWGTVLVGGGVNGGHGVNGGPVALTAGYKGWLRVERDWRQVAVDSSRWIATSAWGDLEVEIT